MGYEFGADLQGALFLRIASDPVFGGVGGPQVFDGIPQTETLPDFFVVIGNETARDASSMTHSATQIDVDITIYSRMDGFAIVKSLAQEVTRILTQPLTFGSPVTIWRFVRSVTRRSNSGSHRYITMIYRAVIQHEEEI